MQIHMSRGCDIHVGNGINANGYILTQYNILRGTIDTFPSAPVACNTQIPYSLLYYTFSYVLIFTLNIYIYIYIYIHNNNNQSLGISLDEKAELIKSFTKCECGGKNYV